MARRRVLADAAADAILELVGERHAVAQPDEQHDALVVVPVLADDEALDDLVELLDLAIDLGGADAHAAGVQHGIRAAVDDDAVVLGDLDPVAVAPDARDSVSK